MAFKRSVAELRSETNEIIHTLERADFYSIADIKELGAYVARLAIVVQQLVARELETSPRETYITPQAEIEG